MTYTASAPDSLRQHYEALCRRIEAAARRCGRRSEELTLIAVTKTHPAETVRQALTLGMRDFGENRVQEAEPKILELGADAARWHLIGHLQANKARRAIKLFDMIHSLDSVSLAQRLNRLCAEEGRAKLPVLIQLDLAGEETKTGIMENDLPALLEVLPDCDHLSLVGLMTLPPLFEDPEGVRAFFRKLREVRDALQRKGHFGSAPGELSTGMTHDFEVAIEEGATMLRIGTAIFGERQTANRTC
ncbi:MAG TPA: YggS family pyridoxal phosphate-dependent enzyme [Pyrinomonadaceae bacterium]|nr:YggS family pyridoxal phosphate-dependent enzyme [Pyrinomonadaceae bacterium]